MRLRTPLPALLLLLALARPTAGQIPGQQAPEPTTVTEHTADPLGRETPRGTIAGFTSAVRLGDWALAEGYMQLTPMQRQSAETLARQLSALLDRYFLRPVTELNGSAAGELDDGLSLDRERVELSLGPGADILLVRVNQPQAGLVWLISSESLARVPILYRSLEKPWVERVMPPSLVGHTVFGVSLARWAVYAASLLGPLLLLRLLSGVALWLARRRAGNAARHRQLDAWYAALGWPLVIALTLAAHLGLMPFLGFTLAFRLAYFRVALAVVVISVAWLILRLLRLVSEYARLAAERRARSDTRSLILLGERVLKVVVILVVVFALLSVAGVNTTAALAGVGIGGIAVALGAQRSVENLLGGISLLSDRALAVGDWCRISDREGWIEDITLRSVRLRTLEQTLLSIPAGVLAQAGVENFATRRKILVHTTLRLRYGTTTDQLRTILERTRALLAEHPRLEPGTARIRLVDFGPHALELGLFAYVLTNEFPEFLAVREELLLRVAAILESAGTGFARPTEFVYLLGGRGAEGGRNGGMLAGATAPENPVNQHLTDSS